ncbi:hypothetical protein [Mycolicibacterium komossense]|uniref:Capsid maturation protease n=1 Tax=Mycolicibacterium komossense TaxID=1779 RepID=A0ABT3C9D6_9MYCO|nr:hypothetical protein [Mycolicibacterium komossense]MCV7226067.1 hypothetical protein [Mycolicibacterium komossense]
MTTGAPELRAALVAIGRALDSDVAKLAIALSPLGKSEALRYITDAYPQVVSPYLAAAGDLTATWYEDQPLAIGAKAFTATPAELPAVDQLAANGRWAMLQQSPSTALQGTSRRQTFQTHRDTVIENADREGVPWVREARPGACGFCRMQATRTLTASRGGGAPGLYRSEQSAGGNFHTSTVTGHDFCRCVMVPMRNGKPYTVPGYVHDWLDDYDAVSRDAAGNLLSAPQIAARMEARAAGRGEVFDAAAQSVTPAAASPKVIDLNTGRSLVKVASERVAPAALSLAQGVVERLAIEAPARQLALNRKPAPLALEAARQPKMLTAAPGTPAVTPPDPHAIAEWLDAEDVHRRAVEYWRRVDTEDLHTLPAAEAIADPPAPPDLPPAAATPVEIPGDAAPVADVRAVDRAGESELDRSVREFEAAIEAGDDARIEAAAAAMDRAEQAEQLAATRAAQRAAKAEAASAAENDRILAAIEGGEDPVYAEADVLIDRPSQRQKIRDMVKSGLYDEEAAKKTVYGQVVERIRRRDFMAQARADGHSGKGFDDLLDSVFQRRVDEIYIEAENATNGQMVKRKYALTYNPKKFWYVNDATARKYMSDELAQWFDENGRITRPIMRQMVLDGSNNFDAYTVMQGDFLQ